MPRSIFALSAAWMALSVSSVQAQTPSPIKLTLTPAKPPTPALKYQLLPDARILISDDAAPLYKQLAQLLQAKKLNQRQELFWTWRDLPLDKLPKDDMRRVLKEYDEVYELLDKAARCERCEWGILQLVREKGMNAKYSEILEMRRCATLLGMRVRLELAEKHHDKALNLLRNGFALARHVGETETYATHLNGLAILEILDAELRLFIEQPEAPNLYYALTDLPSPFVSLRKAISGERVILYASFPGVNETVGNLDAGSLTPKQTEDCVKMVEILCGVQDDTSRKALCKALEEKQETAKKALIKAGRPRERVEAMPSIQIALLHALLEYDRDIDEMSVGHNLPYWIVSTRFAEMEKRFAEDDKRYRDGFPTDPDAPALPLVPRFRAPAINWLIKSHARLDRRIALLRTIEALRFHAANHEGKLPRSLAAVQEVPIPTDPVTGKSFEYQLDGDTATLRAPTPQGEIANASNTVIYMLRMRQ